MYKWIKIKKNTYDTLIFIKSQYEAKEKKIISFDGVIQRLCKLWVDIYDRSHKSKGRRRKGG